MGRPPYLARYGDRLLVRLVTRLIFLHMLICVMALCMTIVLPVEIWEFFTHFDSDTWRQKLSELIPQALFTAALIYIAIRGYWLIKHGPRTHRRRSR